MTNNIAKKIEENTGRRRSSTSDNRLLSLKEDPDVFDSFKSSFEDALDVFLTDDDDFRRVGKYVIMQKIGKGSFGTVNRCIDTSTGEEYAIKEFLKVKLKKVYGGSRFSYLKSESDSFV